MEYKKDPTNQKGNSMSSKLEYISENTERILKDLKRNFRMKIFVGVTIGVAGIMNGTSIKKAATDFLYFIGEYPRTSSYSQPDPINRQFQKPDTKYQSASDQLDILYQPKIKTEDILGRNRK